MLPYIAYMDPTWDIYYHKITIITNYYILSYSNHIIIYYYNYYIYIILLVHITIINIITDIAGAEDELESLLLRYVCCATMAWKAQCFSKHNGGR